MTRTVAWLVALRDMSQQPLLSIDRLSASGARRPRVLGDTAWTLIAVASNGLARIITVVIVGRASGVDLLGTLQTGLSIAQLLVLCLPTALGSAASKFIAQGRANPSQGTAGEVFHFLVKRLRLAVVTLGVASVVTSMTIFQGEFWIAIQVAALTCSLSWYSLTRGLLFGLGLATRSAFWDITTSVFTVALMAGLWVLGGLESFALVVLALAYAVFAAMNAPGAVAGSLSAERKNEIDRFCVAVVVGTFASTGFLQLTMIASRLVGGTEAAGLFAAALSFATPVSLLGASLSLVIFPEISGAMSRGDSRRVTDVVDQTFRTLLLAAVPVFVVVQYAAEPILRVVLGEDFSDASSVLVILVASVLLTTVSIPCVTALTSGGQQGVRASAMLSCCGLIAGLSSWIILIPLLGVEGVAMGFLFGSTVSAAGPILWAWRTKGQTWAVPVVSTLGTIILLTVIRTDAASGAVSSQVAAIVILCLGWSALQVPSIRRLVRQVRS